MASGQVMICLSALAVVRGIAETHAAGVRVTSEPSGLTEFKLAFPTPGAAAAPPDANVA